MKFLHAADLHLDSPLKGLERYEGAPVEMIRTATRRALENLVQLAIRERVDFVVIAGDLYDGDWKDFNTGMFFVRQMARLREAGIHVYLIAGNHDAASTMTRTLRLPDNPDGTSPMLSHELAETRTIENLGIAIHGRSFANQAETQNMIPGYPSPHHGLFNLGILHTSLGGSEEHATYAPCTPIDLQSKGYDYWALGHIHKRSLIATDGTPLDQTPILYSGNIQGRHIREPGPRGCFVVSVTERRETTVTFHTLDVFRWEVCQVDCSQLPTVDDVLAQFRAQVRTLISQHGKVPLGLRVILGGATKAHQQLSSQRAAVVAELRSMATIASDGRIWIEQVKFATDYLANQRPSLEGSGPLEELVKYLDSLPGDQAELSKLADEVKDLARKLPSELVQTPDGLLLTDHDWIREIAKQIKPMLLDRLKSDTN